MHTFPETENGCVQYDGPGSDCRLDSNLDGKVYGREII